MRPPFGMYKSKGCERLELRELRYFVQIARDQSYTKAAEHLYVSQPALSKMIKKLESELGVPLLVTRPNGVFLSDFGQALYNRVVPLLSEFDSLMDFTQDVRSAKNAKLRVGVSPMLADLFLMDAIVDFCNLYPEVEIKLTETGSKAVRRQLADSNLDIGVCIAGDSFDCLHDIVLARDEMVVCVNSANPLARNDSLRFGQLREEYFNMYSSFSTLNDQLLTRCNYAGFNPKINITSSKISLIIQITERGKGICILPRPYAARHCLPGLKLIPLQDSFPWVCCLVTNKNAYQPYVSTLFSNFIVDRAHSESGPFGARGDSDQP